MFAYQINDPVAKASEIIYQLSLRSIFANYIHTNGDAVIQIDADLQDPPELIETFFQRWKQGYDVVYGIRKKRALETKIF